MLKKSCKSLIIKLLKFQHSVKNGSTINFLFKKKLLTSIQVSIHFLIVDVFLTMC